MAKEVPQKSDSLFMYHLLCISHDTNQNFKRVLKRIPKTVLFLEDCHDHRLYFTPIFSEAPGIPMSFYKIEIIDQSSQVHMELHTSNSVT